MDVATLEATTNHSRLPVRYEIIYVLFNMPDDIQIWWKTKLDSITLHNGASVRAIAQVTFTSGSDSAGNNYIEESGVIHFTQGDSAILLTSHSSFSTGSETTWKLQSDLDVNVITSETTSKRVRPTRKCTQKKRVAQQHRDRDPSANQRTIRSRRASVPNARKRVKQEPGTPDDSSQISDEQEQDSHHVSSNESPLAIAVGNLTALYSTLQREMSALQEKVHSMDRYREKQISRDRTKEKRMYLRHELLRQQKRSLTLTSGENNFPFSSAFRRCPYEFSIDCSLKDFAHVARDIHNQFEEGVQFLPSLPSITAESQPFLHKHIIFHNYESLFKWIGNLNRNEQQCIFQQSMRRQGKTVLQVLGGAHWDICNEERSLHFFFGHSASRALPSSKQEEEIQPVLDHDLDIVPEPHLIPSGASVPCITLPSSKWDDTNQRFVHDFIQDSAIPDIQNITASNILDFDCFTVSWKPVKGLRSQDIYTTTNDSDTIVLGKLVLFVPAVLFFGDELSKKVSDIIKLREHSTHS